MIDIFGNTIDVKNIKNIIACSQREAPSLVDNIFDENMDDDEDNYDRMKSSDVSYYIYASLNYGIDYAILYYTEEEEIDEKLLENLNCITEEILRNFSSSRDINLKSLSNQDELSKEKDELSKENDDLRKENEDLISRNKTLEDLLDESNQREIDRFNEEKEEEPILMKKTPYVTDVNSICNQLSSRRPRKFEF